MTLPPNDLSPVAASAYAGLTDSQQVAFSNYYTSNKRNMGLMVILSIFLPVQLFFLGKPLLGVLFLLTGGGFGVWYIVEWFLTPGRVRDYNAKVAADGMALIGSGRAAPAKTKNLEEAEEEE
jgi:TM2 domain